MLWDHSAYAWKDIYPAVLRAAPSVAGIAGRVGYDSLSKFAIVFRRLMGMSPAEYRRRML